MPRRRLLRPVGAGTLTLVLTGAGLVRPSVETARIAADGRRPVTSSPSYPDDLRGRTWPYELRLYDPPPDGFAVTLRLPGGDAPRLRVSDHTVGLAGLPGFTPRPAGLDRSPDHSSDLVVLGRTVHP